jgi:hypothetical protein
MGVVLQRRLRAAQVEEGLLPTFRLGADEEEWEEEEWDEEDEEWEDEDEEWDEDEEDWDEEEEDWDEEWEEDLDGDAEE